MKNGTVLKGFAKMDHIYRNPKTSFPNNLNIPVIPLVTLYPPSITTSNPVAAILNEPLITILQCIVLDGRKIKPFETDSIILDYHTGVPYNDTLWLFKIIDGTISTFSLIPPEKGAEQFIFIQKEGSEICRYSLDMLKHYLMDNEYALSLFATPKDDRSKVLMDYHPQKAIFEYNFQATTKKNRIKQLSDVLKTEKNIEKKVAICKEIISIDSSSYSPYLFLGDQALINNNKEEAYFYYTNFLRYCFNTAELNKVRKKILKLNKTPQY